MEPIDAQAEKPLNDLNRSLRPIDPSETLIGMVELSSVKGAGVLPATYRAWSAGR